MTGRIEISVTISGLSRLFPEGLADVVEAARIADAAGVDQLALPDHLAIGPNLDAYPYGRFPLPADEPWLEPLTTLAAIAGATREVRLATGVLIVPLRPALLLAKSVATLDVLSRGRVDLGVGSGWQAEEFAGAGVPFEARGSRMEDSLRACRVLWRDSPATFRSETVGFEDLRCLPRPVQSGGIPVWFGGGLSQRNLRRIVELGVGWLPIAAPLPELSAGARRLRAAFVDAGRDPAELKIRGAAPALRDGSNRVDLDRSLEALPRLAEAGATVASFPLAQFARRPEEVRPLLERLGRAPRAFHAAVSGPLGGRA